MKAMQISLFFFIFAACSQAMGQSSVVSMGGDIENVQSCLPEEDRKAIQLLLAENIQKYGYRSTTSSKAVSDLIFPLRAKEIPGYYHYHGVSGYVDQDNGAGIQDYNCQSTTYNGHKGTDYFTYPFAWHLFENDLVEVIAASAGKIVLKQDNNFDRNCSPSGQWNAVYIEHPDGSVMWYGHLKIGSLTSKALGESVEQGEYLGIVGSSGRSSGAHLHMEYYDENDRLLDPYQGNCNSLNATSFWKEQPPHKSPKINAVLTHAVAPKMTCGPNNEVSELKNTFLPNEDIFVGAYFTDVSNGDVATIKIFRPDSTLFNQFTASSSNNFQWFFSFRSYQLTESDMEGTYQVTCSYKNETRSHTFEFSKNATAIDGWESEDFTLYPNPTEGLLILEGIELRDEKFEVMNAAGQSLTQGTLLQNRLELPEMAAGIYYIRIGTGKETIVKKFLVKK